MITETTQQRLAALNEYVESTDRGDRWLVLTHDNPDPDSLVSALILTQLLRRHLNRKVTTAYGGIIGRAENRELFRILGSGFSHIRHLNLKNYSHFALVDSQPHTGNSQLPGEMNPDVVIDHHPVRKATLSVPFRDVRTDYGATATILAEYALAAEMRLTRAMATGILYALRSETQDFGREATAPDKAIHDHFLPLSNKRLMGRILNATLPEEYFRTLHQALQNLEGVDTLILTHLETVEHPEIVPEIADLLLRMEGRTWSLVTGRHEDRIYLSIRTTNPRADAGRLMRKLVGRKGKGGGHGMIAGGWVEITRPEPEKIQAQQRQLAARLAKYLKKRPEKIAPLGFGGAEIQKIEVG